MRLANCDFQISFEVYDKSRGHGKSYRRISPALRLEKSAKPRLDFDYRLTTPLLLKVGKDLQLS